jgi:hypothetical protein
MGMSMEEVVDILGASPGNCSKRFWKIGITSYMGTTVGNKATAQREGQEFFWMGDKGTIKVVFDRNGKVRQKSFTEAPAEPCSKVIQQIFDWLTGF